MNTTLKTYQAISIGDSLSLRQLWAYNAQEIIC